MNVYTCFPEGKAKALTMSYDDGKIQDERLVEIFDKEEAAAVALMMSIHKGNYAIAGVYPRDIAQTKASEAVQWARSEGHPLKVEAVRQP